MITKFFFARNGAVWSGLDDREKAIEWGQRIAASERASGRDIQRDEFGGAHVVSYVIETHVYDREARRWDRVRAQDVRL